MTRALLLIDHGSKRTQAHAQLVELADRLRERLGGDTVVEVAHMEIAEPSIEQGVAACAERGATQIVAIPCLLSRGRHVTEDIPRLLADASQKSAVPAQLAPPLVELDGFIDLLVSASRSLD